MQIKSNGNQNVRVYQNPETGEEEMYVSMDLVPESVQTMCMRVVGSCQAWTYLKAGSYNFFFAMKKEQDELRQLLRR
jgi:hypothetical protein